MSAPGGRGWYRRGYLPHLEVAGRSTGITFRLADSLPRRVVEHWKQELGRFSDAGADEELARKVARYEDLGKGRCWLGRPECAEVVERALQHHDGRRYELLEWCVMPNHVHVLVRLKAESNFETVVRSWKSYSGRRINGIIGGIGRLWAPDFFDRLIRDDEHLARARRYIRMNPVKARLCMMPGDWRWSSAWEGRKD